MIKNLLTILLSVLTLGNTVNTTTPEEPTVPEKAPTEIEINADTKIHGDNFTDKLYNLMPEDKNYMYSPYSIKSALAMAANGASGRTQREILKVTGIEDLDAFNESMKATIEKYADANILKLDISNSIWLNTDRANYNFSNEFSKKLSEFYNAESGKVTNSNAVPTINKWVNDKTNGKIPSLISDSAFETALINAIYFNAKWENEFSKQNTKPDIFTDRNGKQTEIDFMNTERKMFYGEKDGVMAVELPYMTRSEEENLPNTSVSMFLLLSDSDIKNPEKTVTELCENDELQNRKVKLSFPKFKIEYSTEISKALKALGINDAFGSNADFTKMFDSNANSNISSVIHKTYIDVDEEGTEAAAVTAIIMMGSAMPRPEEVIEFKCDKPFTFLIRDNNSGETLFIGEYAFAE